MIVGIMGAAIGLSAQKASATPLAGSLPAATATAGDNSLVKNVYYRRRFYYGRPAFRRVYYRPVYYRRYYRPRRVYYRRFYRPRRRVPDSLRLLRTASRVLPPVLSVGIPLWI